MRLAWCFFFFHLSRVTELKNHSNHFFLCFNRIRLTNYTADHGAGLLGLLSVRPCGGREFSDLVNWKVAQSWQD